MDFFLLGGATELKIWDLAPKPGVYSFIRMHTLVPTTYLSSNTEFSGHVLFTLFTQMHYTVPIPYLSRWHFMTSFVEWFSVLYSQAKLSYLEEQIVLFGTENNPDGPRRDDRTEPPNSAEQNRRLSKTQITRYYMWVEKVTGPRIVPRSFRTQVVSYLFGQFVPIFIFISVISYPIWSFRTQFGHFVHTFTFIYETVLVISYLVLKISRIRRNFLTISKVGT